MKIGKLEQITLFITILALLAMVSYFLAVNLSARPVTFVADDPNADPLVTQTSSGLPDPSAPPFPININKASEAELILLPGIGKPVRPPSQPTVRITVPSSIPNS